ncbi:MAG: elongation factor G, partial [Bryobacterales bacterium]|nr:elongation factor G [Bryobacterales bacterium]
MKVYTSTDIRNVGLIGHGHCGKTSIAAGMLYAAGATNRLTRVDEGNTITDFDEEEVNRKITISTACAALEWKKQKINLLDTPGFSLFINDAKGALVAAEAALVVVDGVAGVEVQTEKGMAFCDHFQIARAIVVNKLDRERSSFERAMESITGTFGRSAVPVHLPVGSEKDFKGVVDLVTMKAYTYTPDGDGKGKEGEIPADLAEAAKTAHEALVEMVAEGNDALMEEFFETGTLPVDHIQQGLRQAVLERRLLPVLCCSGLHNIGTDLLLNFIVESFPSPAERPAMKSTNGADRAFSATQPVAAFVFKTMADAFAGRMTYFKVISGVVKNDANLINSRT